MSPSRGPCAEFQLEYQQIASGIISQPSRYKRAESHLLADEIGTQQGDLRRCLVIHLYLLLRAPQASVITAPPPRIIHPPPHLFEFIINKNMLPLSLNT